MGSAAFLNEAVTQLAEKYLERRQRERQQRIPHADYADELQKTKHFITDRNVFGVDLNPVARELAEVSLWLNCIHKDGHVPWFGYQLACGNSLVGATAAGVRQQQSRQREPSQGRALVQLRPGTGGDRRSWHRLSLPSARPGHGRLPQQSRHAIRGRQRQTHQGMAKGVLPAVHCRRDHRIGGAVPPHRRTVGAAHRATRPRPPGDGRLTAGMGASVLDAPPAYRQRLERPHPRTRRVQPRHTHRRPLPPREAGDGLLVRAVVLAD